MNRDIKNDFERLISYFAEYNLNEIITNSNFINNAKIIHRKLYSYQIFVREAECSNLFKDNIIQKYYDESCSDLLLSLFCWSNGAYKPAEFQIRSSIENFIKASLFNEWPDVVKCKNVYEIMDFANSSNYFSGQICQNALQKIQNTYSNLCAFVHGSPDKLISQSALIQLPQYDNTHAHEFTQNYQAVINNFLSILYFNNYDFIFSLHVTNRDLFFQGLTASDKSMIYNEKTKI